MLFNKLSKFETELSPNLKKRKLDMTMQKLKNEHVRSNFIPRVGKLIDIEALNLQKFSR